MTDQEHLKYCLLKIEEKLNWEESSLWKESDYIKLSEIISDASEISISSHTLKRLYGKIKYNEYYNPQQATKDALSKFLGFENWNNFILHQQKSEDSIFKRRKKSFILVPSIVILLLLTIFLFTKKSSKTEQQDFFFNIKDSISIVPFTVNTNYTFTKKNSENLLIDFNFTHPFKGEQIIKPHIDKSSTNFTYQIPGYYQIRLKNDVDTLVTKNILALSNGWDSYVLQEGLLNNYWIDNKIPKTSTPKDFLYYSAEEITTNGLAIKPVFYIANRLFKEFEIDGDNFEMETRFKNSKAYGGITCYDFILKLICRNNTNHIKLMETGCSQFSGIKIGETILDGAYENLSSFKINIEDWNTLYVLVKQKNVQVFINNKLIYSGNYKQPNGKIIGIENLFKGSGLLDYIKIKDLKTNNLFFDDFN